MKYKLDEQTVQWTENWTNGQAQRVVISHMKSSWRPVTNGINQESILVLILFNVLINDLDGGAKFPFSNFADDTRVRKNSSSVEYYGLCRRKETHVSFLHEKEKWGALRSHFANIRR